MTRSYKRPYRQGRAFDATCRKLGLVNCCTVKAVYDLISEPVENCPHFLGDWNT